MRPATSSSAIPAKAKTGKQMRPKASKQMLSRIHTHTPTQVQSCSVLMNMNAHVGRLRQYNSWQILASYRYCIGSTAGSLVMRIVCQDGRGSRRISFLRTLLLRRTPSSHEGVRRSCVTFSGPKKRRSAKRGAPHCEPRIVVPGTLQWSARKRGAPCSSRRG